VVPEAPGDHLTPFLQQEAEGHLTEGNTMALSAAEKEAVVRRISVESIRGGDMAVIDELVRDDFFDHGAAAGAPQGREGFKGAIQMLRTALPDIAPRPLRYIVDGDRVMGQYEGRATHLGDFGAIPPTGKTVQYLSIEIVYLDGDGQVVERWLQMNVMEILQQLGVVPGAPSPWQLGTEVPDVPPGRATTPEENKDVFLRHVEEIWNQGNLDAADDLFHPQAVTPYAPQLPPGPEGCKMVAGMFRSAFSDYDILASGDLVGARMTNSGTHTGDLFGIPPTGKSVSFEELAIVQIADGKILASWFQSDQMAMMQQLGLGG
jgi:predicted ester cyclase